MGQEAVRQQYREQTELRVPQTPEVEGVELTEAPHRLQAEQAVPALSSCRTQWPLALRLSLSPQQRGLHRLAQRRWITLSSAVEQVVAVAAAAALAVFAQAPLYL